MRHVTKTVTAAYLNHVHKTIVSCYTDVISATGLRQMRLTEWGRTQEKSERFVRSGFKIIYKVYLLTHRQYGNYTASGNLKKTQVITINFFSEISEYMLKISIKESQHKVLYFRQW